MQTELAPAKVRLSDELGQLPERLRSAALPGTRRHILDTEAADEIDRLRGLLHRQYCANIALMELPNDSTEEQYCNVIKGHHAAHLLLIAEFEPSSKPDKSASVT